MTGGALATRSFGVYSEKRRRPTISVGTGVRSQGCAFFRRNVMKKVALLLAALASGKRASHSVAQVQRILFLIDRNIPEAIDGPAFRFALRDRGPFDPRVCTLLEELTTDGFAAFGSDSHGNVVTLTASGREFGEELLKEIPESTVDYMRRALDFVASSSTRVLFHIAHTSFSGKPKLRLVTSQSE